MERFAINILHKQIYKICRLCGVDQPSKVPILEETDIEIIVGDEEEATLAKKILDCVGIEVTKDDKMPQNICSLCVDKISDFYEYRLMCAATNLQTRTILNLPLVEPSRKAIAAGPKADVKDVKEDVKIEAASSSSSKKGKKRRGPPSPSPSPSPAPTTRVKAPVDVKDEPVPSTPVKALTKKERLKQLQQQQLMAQQKLEKDKEAEAEQKQTRSKRREPSPEVVEASSSKQAAKPEVTVPVPKKIKFEHPCSFCSDEFKTQTELDSHLGLKHVPTVRKFGCGSCRETFESILEFKDHNLWHQLTRTPYTCFKCKRKWDKNAALVKHISLNACGRVSRGRPPAILPDVQCRLCNRKFKTQNLFEWHGCFLKPKSKCPKCDKYFVKKQILTRHYMMFCTGTLPPPEPLLIPKEEPVEQPTVPNSKAGAPGIVPGTAVGSAERRTRRSMPTEPELPKEEREIPFPPPLELEPETPPASSSGKKRGRPKNVPVETPAVPNVAAEKIATLLDTGSKLDKDTDIATINNLLSSVTEAIASISEAKAKKKKKKKDKTKDRVRNADTPTVENSSSPVDTRTEEERQADEFAEQAAQLSMNEQLALCKMPMVVLAKTTFKQETTEIDTEPSQLQEPLGNGDDDDDEDNNYEESGNDYGGFQDEDDEENPPSAAPAPEPAAAEEIPFPMPIKQEEEPAAAASAGESESQSQKTTDKETQETLFNAQLALNIKREPGLEEESEAPVAKRRRAESRTSVASPASSLSSSSGPARGSPKPTLILKIKKEKGLLNATVQEPISLDGEEEEEDAGQPPERSQSRIYKKPNVLAVRIKQEKVDPAYDRQEHITAQNSELPGGILIKQERIDPEDLDSSSPIEAQELDEPPARKKPRQTREPSPVIAFDGVRIKQEKPDEPVSKPAAPSPSPDVTSKPAEKKKKSKVKINPFALLKQRMAAEAAASQTSTSETSPQPQQQSASPLPVITNVVGNAPPTASTASSSTRSSISGDAESEQPVPVIAQVQSIAKEPTVEDDFPMPIKEEPAEESAAGSGDKAATATAEDPEEEEQFPMPIKEEAPEETPPAESPSGEEEPEFPMPIKEELEESQNGVAEPPATIEEPSTTEEKSENVPEPVDEPATNEKDDEEDTSPDEAEEPATNEKDCEEDTPLDGESKSSPQETEEPEEEEERKLAESPEEQESPTEDQDSAEASPAEPSPPEVPPEEEAESSPEQTNGDVENAQDEPETPQVMPDEPLEDIREESTSPISDTPLDDYEQNSQEPAAAAVPEKPDEPAKAPESDLEELQNLLTEGLRPPDLDCSTSTSAVPNVDQSTALDVDLDSLLNNKLDEISGSVPTGQPDDLQLAIERELLNEMMPPDPAATTAPPPQQNNSSSELDVSKELLAEGGSGSSGNGHEQPL